MQVLYGVAESQRVFPGGISLSNARILTIICALTQRKAKYMKSFINFAS